MEQVKSPYNFVPAPSEDQVFKPEWANQVSHDIPFEDGQSGELDITITAETPIFIRNGHSIEDHGIYEKWKKDENIKLTDIEKKYLERYLSFSNIDGRFFIPATSIKGMLRNVLEIISFSRMRQVDSSPFYGLRDMNNKDYKFETNQKELKSGWLKLVNGNWIVEEVQHVRISMQDIEQKYQIRNRGIQSAKTALEKYTILNGNILNAKFEFVKELIKNPPGFNYGKLYKFSESGDFSGTIVLYGNIGNKHYDFVFGKDVINTHDVENSLISNMEKLDQPLWDFHKKSNQIPIFFKTEGNKVKHFGFSKLYRLNNGNRIANLSPIAGYKEGKDLAELIFGYSDEENESLKGRLFISNAFCSGNIVQQKNTETRVLSTPKPSYYPSYLKQDSFNADGSIKSYKTYVNKSSELAGFKRYPVHQNIKLNGNNENENIPSSFIPLPAGTVFNCKIRFHNLKKIELGALLSAITFHNNLDFSHSIGGAKPYGFGKVKIDNKMIKAEYLDTLSDFESKMDWHVCKEVHENKKWISSPQIIELFANAKGNLTNDRFLVYPQLEKPNEFNNIKNANKYLVPTSIANGIPTIKPFKSQKLLDELISNFDLENINTFSDLQNKIREELSDNVPENVHQLLISKIKEIYISHKDSRKKLSKPYEEYFIKTPITKWLGETQAIQLHKELTSK